MDTRWTKPIILTVPVFEDFRGYLAVPYDKSINFTIRQVNQGYSRKAFTLRGLHFQEGEHAQAKLVSCLHGSIFNVAVDLRLGETFGHACSRKSPRRKWQRITLQRARSGTAVCSPSSWAMC